MSWAGVTVVSLLFMDIPLATKLVVLLWKAVFIAASRISWKKQYPDALWMSIPVLLGIYAFYRVMTDMTGAGGLVPWIAWLLGGFILCSALFAMNLGHWYLNVHGLPIAHFKKAVNVFGAVLALRLFVGCLFSGYRENSVCGRMGAIAAVYDETGRIFSLGCRIFWIIVSVYFLIFCPRDIEAEKYPGNYRHFVRYLMRGFNW